MPIERFEVTIPTKEHLRLFAKRHFFPNTEKYYLRKTDYLGSVIASLASKRYAAYPDNYSSPYFDSSFTVVLNSYQTRLGEFDLTMKHIQEINTQLHAMHKLAFEVHMMALEPVMNIKKAINLFRLRYGMLPDHRSDDALRKAWFRFREGQDDIEHQLFFKNMSLTRVRELKRVLG